ncbi:radical SAM protein [Clostridium sp. 19966]|uniref:radical SAM protein n=1 Tax=Clostridium sp. 19966 TaxID=2768166 RepID=UPI0028E0487B|nr:radical SAM protein [Clostridium sp. 19966]MDT8717345.1 radical SAM protein [Clostridium sp. 19966]
MNNKIAIAHFDVTSKCNFRCAHCYAGDVTNSNSELTYDEIKTIINNLSIPGVETIAFYGGEPLMRKDIEDIVGFCSSKGIATYIVTNGYYISNKIKALLERGLSGVAVSIDGASEETYRKIRGINSFKLIKDNFKILSSLNVKDRVINFVMMKENIFEVTDIIDYALEVGATRINYELLAYGGNASKYNVCNELTPEEFVQAIEKICAYAYEKNIKEELINLDICPPKLIEFMNNKYKTKFSLTRKRQHIPLELMYINFKGTAFPCKGLCADFNYKKSNYKIKGYDLLGGNALAAIKSEEFMKTFSELGPNVLLEKLSCCNGCKYLINYCYPCPISALSSDDGIARNCTEYPISEVCKLINNIN